MGLQLLRHILADIRAAYWYSIIVDETRDVSGKEQLALSIRWVDAMYDVHEDLVGLVEVQATDAETLEGTIKDSLFTANIAFVTLCWSSL